MERGTVTYVGFNTRGIQYGFVRTVGGEELYFHWEGGYASLVVTDDEVRLAHNWMEALQGKLRRRSPFPVVGQELVFHRAPGLARFGMRPKAHMWYLACELTREKILA